jgi:hypothetical protein
VITSVSETVEGVNGEGTALTRPHTALGRGRHDAAVAGVGRRGRDEHAYLWGSEGAVVSTRTGEPRSGSWLGCMMREAIRGHHTSSEAIRRTGEPRSGTWLGCMRT